MGVIYLYQLRFFITLRLSDGSDSSLSVWGSSKRMNYNPLPMGRGIHDESVSLYVLLELNICLTTNTDALRIPSVMMLYPF